MDAGDYDGYTMENAEDSIADDLYGHTEDFGDERSYDDSYTGQNDLDD